MDTDVFLDLRRLVGDLDIAPATDVLLGGADSPRLLHGLAIAATSFPTALNPFGRLPHGPVDLKRTGLAPLVLLARLYGLDARSSAVSTRDRLAATADAGLLSEELVGRLVRRLRGAVPAAARRPGRPGREPGSPCRTWSSSTTSPRRTGAALREAFRAVRASPVGDGRDDTGPTCEPAADRLPRRWIVTRWRVLALIAIATLVPGLTVAVVLADLPAGIPARPARLTGHPVARPRPGPGRARRRDRMGGVEHVALRAAPRRAAGRRHRDHRHGQPGPPPGRGDRSGARRQRAGRAARHAPRTASPSSWTARTPS